MPYSASFPSSQVSCRLGCSGKPQTYQWTVDLGALHLHCHNRECTLELLTLMSHTVVPRFWPGLTRLKGGPVCIVRAQLLSPHSLLSSRERPGLYPPEMASQVPPAKVPGLVSLESPGSYLIIPEPPGLRPLRVQCPPGPCLLGSNAVCFTLSVPGPGTVSSSLESVVTLPSLCGTFVCCSCPLFPFLRSPILVPGTHKVIGGSAVAVYKGAGLRHTPATTLPWLGLVLRALQEE